MKKIFARTIFFVSLILINPIIFSEGVRADDDRDVTPEEFSKIEQVVNSQGCSLGNDDNDDNDNDNDEDEDDNNDNNVNFYLKKQVYEVSDVICDGKKYEMIIDQNFNFVSKTEDD